MSDETDKTSQRARVSDAFASDDDSGGFDRTATRDPLIGMTLGEYVVRARLGAGAMGVVYRGEQPVIGKAVAIKILRAELDDDPKNAQRLLEEARAVNAAHHPHIIDIFGFGQTPMGQHYLVMELLDGDALEDYLRNEGGRLTVGEAIALLKQVASGLQAAHAAGVIHRDLKPANLFVVRLGDGSRFVKLLDFGLAKRGAPHGAVRPTANIVVGTPLYMAPEQVTATDVTPATDLYALGCIAYELVTGNPPFVANSVLELLELHTTTMPERPVLDDVPGEYFDLVFALLRKDMKQRPQSAGDVKKELERIEKLLATRGTRGSGLQQYAPRPTRIRPPPPERDTAPDAEPAGSAPATATALALLAARSPARWPWVVLGAAALPAVLGVGIVIGRRQPPAIVQTLTPPTLIVPRNPVPSPAPSAPAAPLAHPAPVLADVPRSHPVGQVAAAPAPKARPAVAPPSKGDVRRVQAEIDAVNRRAAALDGTVKRLMDQELDGVFSDLGTLSVAQCLAEIALVEKKYFAVAKP